MAALPQTSLWSGESDTLIIDGTTYTECQSLNYTSGEPRLVNARAMGNLEPVDKEIGLADDQPFEVTGLVADATLLSVGGKIVTVEHRQAGVTTVYKAEVRFRGPRITAAHDNMYVMNLSGNAKHFDNPSLTHMTT